MNDIKRAAVLVHYDRDNIVDPYVYTYLKALKSCTTYLVFVSTAKLDDDQIKELNTYCDKVIIRENIGYDFMSYKIGLDSFSYKQYDELVLCNDSVYGPLYPIERLFSSMKERNCDFWGITDNSVMGYHIQSYFMVFKRPMLQSITFEQFWNSVKALSKKDDIIKCYEVGLSQTLLNANYTSAVSTNFKPTFVHKFTILICKLTPMKIIKKIFFLIKGKDKLKNIGHTNITHYFWKELLYAGDAPFIKIELLRDNPMEVDIKDVQSIINKVSKYDVTLITNHLTRIKERE